MMEGLAFLIPLIGIVAACVALGMSRRLVLEGQCAITMQPSWLGW